MAIVLNQSTEDGDILIIKSEVPIIGLIALYDFIDDVDGETANVYFSKTFRYSVDGINYTPFIALTVNNLSTIEINSTDTFYVEYRYTRVGTDPDTLAFNYVQLEGDYEEQEVGQAWTDSNFSPYLDYNGVCTIGWSVNVLEKLYKQGLLPKFITRGKSNSNAEDRDFLDFWRSITHYYAWYVCLARYYKYFYNDPALLEEYLIQRGLYLRDSDNEIQDLLFIMQNCLDEVRQRGTIQIIKEEGITFDTVDIQSSSSASASNSGSSTSNSVTPTDPLEVKQVDGEYLRLITYNFIDEFVFNLNKNEHIGWNVGNASPLYFGNGKVDDINKYLYDSVGSASDYNTFGNGSVSVDYSSAQEQDILVINTVTAGQVEGIGFYDANFLVKVNPSIDYEITFMVQQDINVENISFGCFGYDINYNQVDLVDCDTLLDSNYFFQEKGLSNPRYNLIRGIIYATNKISAHSLISTYEYGQIVSSGGFYYKALKSVTSGINITNTNYWALIDSLEEERMLRTNTYLGNNLQFKANIIKILPYIVLDNTSSVGGELRIHSIKISPLQANYSTGFIQVPNILEIWNVNRNKSYSTIDIENIAKRYLFPYNVTPIWNWLGEPDVEAEVASNIRCLLDPETDQPILDPESGDPIFILD